MTSPEHTDSARSAALMPSESCAAPCAACDIAEPMRAAGTLYAAGSVSRWSWSDEAPFDDALALTVTHAHTLDDGRVVVAGTTDDLRATATAILPQGGPDGGAWVAEQVNHYGTPADVWVALSRCEVVRTAPTWRTVLG